MSLTEGAAVLVAGGPVTPAEPSGHGRAVPPTGQPSVRARLLTGVGWNTIGNCLGQGASLLASIVVARALGRESFGEFVLVQSTVVAMSSLACLGLGTTTMKYVSEFRVTDPARAGRVVGLSTLVSLFSGVAFAIALIALAPTLSPSGAGSAAVAQGLRWSAPYVFWMALNGCQLGTLAGLEKFRTAARIAAINGFATLLFTWPLTAAFGLRGAVAAQSTGAFFLWLQYHLAIGRENRRQRIAVRYRNTCREWSILTRVSAPATISGFLGSAAIWWCNALVVKVVNYGELAIFGAANNLRLATLFFPLIVFRVAGPLLSNLAASHDWARYRRIFWGVTALAGGVAACFALTFGLFGHTLLRLFGKDFVSPPMLIGVLLGSAVLEALAGGLFQAIFTSGNLWLHFLISTAWAIVLILGTRVAVSRWGATGLALAYALAWACSSAGYAFVAVRRLSQNTGGRGAAISI